jgi:hypothetical protein
VQQVVYILHLVSFLSNFDFSKFEAHSRILIQITPPPPLPYFFPDDYSLMILSFNRVHPDSAVTELETEEARLPVASLCNADTVQIA